VIRSVFVLLAAALLGGCFYSERPLIGRFAVDFPLGEGIYSHTPYHPDGRPFDRPMWTGAVVRRGGYYHSDIADFPHEGVRLREIAPDTYAGMRERDGLYFYGIVFVYPGGIATYHQPQCDDLDAAARRRYELVEDTEEPGTCEAADWERLRGALLTYIAQHDGNVPVDGVYRRVE
jgi:hypothetical protein